ncbi:MAG: hypothetical protein IJB55_02655 [Firmicutes bacterium]|nr:hypothetical protein [Bacillota bacterium]
MGIFDWFDDFVTLGPGYVIEDAAWNFRNKVDDVKTDIELLFAPEPSSSRTTSNGAYVQENTGVVSAGTQTDSAKVSKPAVNNISANSNTAKNNVNETVKPKLVSRPVTPEPAMVEEHSASIEETAEPQEEPRKIKVAEWLAMEMQHQMPDISAQKIVEVAIEVISIITIDETKAESYVVARKKGISKATWREEHFDAALGKLGNEENKQQYRQHLEEILTRLKDKVVEL